MFSGGDDCKLKCFDVTSGPRCAFVIKEHTMGVTSILSDARNEFRLFSGSYDEKLNIWDTRFVFQLHLKKATSDEVNGLREKGVREEKTDSVLISTMSS